MTVRQSSAAGVRRAERSRRESGTGTPVSPAVIAVATSYAIEIRRAMEERHVTAAELADLTGYSYEQIRRILKGEPIVSEQLNQLLCARLTLDVATMWSMALHEKAMRRMSGDAAEAGAHDEQHRLLAAYARLGEADRRRVMRLLDRLEHP